jgi:hypothetical protein
MSVALPASARRPLGADLRRLIERAVSNASPGKARRELISGVSHDCTAAPDKQRRRTQGILQIMRLDSTTNHSYKSRDFTVRVTEDATGFLVAVVIEGLGGQKSPQPYRNHPLAEAAGISLARGLIDVARLV